MSAPVAKDFTVYTNADWRDSIVLTGAADLTGATVKLQARVRADFPQAEIEMSSAGVSPELTVNIGTKTISWAMTQVDVSDLRPGGYPYDVVVIYADTSVARLAGGTIAVVRGVTDPALNPPVLEDIGYDSSAEEFVP